ncbi:uncharacterized protein [Dermacentor andersoni]|uniref:uncharacterized protein n=1 Tax=Dermacentor andersoni TaxID=34620 RepID=UPI0024174940|nr:uncharacterized protein LOC129385282 [Dermacentor andersoni]
MPAPAPDEVDTAIVNLNINEGLQEQEDAMKAAIANHNAADEESLEDNDEEMPAPAFDDGAIVNNADGFLQEPEEAVEAANHNADEGELEEYYDEQVVIQLIHAALYQICLLIGSLVIGVSSAVYMYRVETSLNWWSEEAARGHVLLPVGLVCWLKWRAHAFLAANLLASIVGFLGSLRVNLHLLLFYIIVVAVFIPAPFVVVVCCLLPHSMSCYVSHVTQLGLSPL